MLKRVVFQYFNKIILLCAWEVLGGAQKCLPQTLKNKMFWYRNKITKKKGTIKRRKYKFKIIWVKLK